MINGKCSDLLNGRDITEEDVIKYIACIAKRQAFICAERGLHCVDVPCFSSSIVVLQGQNRYMRIRKIWKIIKKFLVSSERRIRIYEDDLLKVDLYIVMKKGTLYIDKSEMFMLDEYDSKNMQCTQITNTYKLYTYLEARLEENFIRINTIYLLKKLIEAGHEDLVDLLFDTIFIIYDIKRGNFDRITDLYMNINNIISKLHNFKDVLRDILPEIYNSNLIEKLKKRIKPLNTMLSR